MPAMTDILRARRSCRRFTDQPLEGRQVELLREAALRSPTSRNLRPWRFYFVTRRKLIEALARAKPHGSAFLAGAALAVVVAGDEDTSDTWIEDCSIASIILQLAAQDLGLGSCWCQIRLREHGSGQSAEDHVRALLDMPHNLRVESIIGIGHPDEDLPGRDLPGEPQQWIVELG